MKKVLLILLSLIMIISIVPMSTITTSAASYSGACGESVYWNFDNSTGTLTISGTGEMDNYTFRYRPWDSIDYRVKAIVIEDGVTSIGRYAFFGFSYVSNFDSLTSVTIGKNVESIGDNAFSYCPNLTSITIPDNVIAIGDFAFSTCKNLTDISIGNGVISIGSHAFAECTSLTNITIPDSVLSINSYAFSECVNLKSIFIPDSVTMIGFGVFSNCNSLTSITVDSNNKYYLCDEHGVLLNKDKTTLIQYPAGNTETSYTMPDSIILIGDSAFRNCHSLTNIIITDSVTTISNYAFRGCTSLGNITIPDSVTTIGDYAFFDCINLKKITIPDSVTSIGNSAFRNCYRIASVTISENIAQISDLAFEGCSNLRNVTIPNSVENIGDYAFASTGLNSITIPDSVISIGDCAFLDTEINQVSIPGNLTYLGERAFWGCENLTNIFVDNANNYYSNDEYGVLFDKNKTTLIQHPSNNTRKSYVVPDSTKTITSDAFYGSKNLEIVSIPDSVTAIGNDAFSNCINITSITIPESVNSIGSYAFYNTGYYNDETKWDNDSLYIDNCLIEVMQEDYDGFVIKDGTRVIADYCFNGSMVTNVTIPDSVVNVGHGTFYGCENLKRVSVNNNNNYYSNDTYGVLFNKDKTKIIYYPKGNSRTEYIIPDGTTIVEDICFYYCENLKRISIPDGMKTIGENAFYACDIQNIILPDSITEIGEGAFNFCRNLLSITIPEKIIKINEYTFNNCERLEKVMFAGMITNISEKAFYGCDSLSDVYYTGNENQWKNVNIEEDNTPLLNATIHYNSIIRPEVKLTIQTPSRTEIRNKDGIILHANFEGSALAGSYIKWESSNGNFSTSANGSDLKIIADNKGWTTFTAILFDADGNELSRDTIDMYSKSGFFDKIAGFFRSLFGATKIYDN